MNSKYKNKAGLTLIEVLIYSAIITGFLSFTILSTFQLIEYGDRLEKQRELNENRRFLIQKLQWVLSSAETVNSPALGGTSTSLSVDKIGFASNPIVINDLNGVLRMSLGAGDPVALTNRFASTSNLLFDYQDFSGERMMKITADLENEVATTSINFNILIK